MRILDDHLEFVGSEQTQSQSFLQRLQRTAGDTAIVAQHHYRIKAVKCDMPALILPLQGEKRVHVNGQSWACSVGEYVMLHQALSAEVENIPGSEAPYRAWIVGFSWRLIDLAKQLIVERAVDLTRVIVSQGALSTMLMQAINRYSEAVHVSSNKNSQSEIDLSLIGILVALHAGGDTGFLVAADPALGSKIRIMVSAEPARDWCSADFEDAFHMSGATLRRRLVEEGISLRAAIRQARLHVALSLLQTSIRSVKTVAAQCGYRSVASFRENFIEQFGVDPKIIANG